MTATTLDVISSNNLPQWRKEETTLFFLRQRKFFLETTMHQQTFPHISLTRISYTCWCLTLSLTSQEMNKIMSLWASKKVDVVVEQATDINHLNNGNENYGPLEDRVLGEKREPHLGQRWRGHYSRLMELRREESLESQNLESQTELLVLPLSNCVNKLFTLYAFVSTAVEGQHLMDAWK